ncbi:MAG: hypothetical protein HY289_16700 [Planctomycetes bacterium]|nr:hypothetical protein [Planctomycetota bacterium]
MATVLDSRKSSKPEAYLQRKFADLCARIKRMDLLAHLLMLTLTVLSYALFAGLFDAVITSNADWVHATRWAGYAGFLCVLGFFVVQTVRCAWRRVNPYYVAHQLEGTLPDARNSLINWLDLQDEDIPTAFQRNLSARAAEQLQESDVEQTLPRRKNWVLAGTLVVPTLGLFILLLLGPANLFASMLRAFVPFYTPAAVARTQITIVQPEGGDAEVLPGQAITIVARIEGRVPTGNRPDAPTLWYRYQATEDFVAQPLQSDGAGLWTVQMQAAQVRTGFTYKLSAGDVETPEHQVRVRVRAHVKLFEVTYHHPAYRQLPKSPASVFPNPNATRPIIQGPPGSEVELVIHASRPVQKAIIEFATAAGKKETLLDKRSDDVWTCKWKLESSGKFRVLLTATDGEENADRDWHPIDVRPDDAPVVVLTLPGKDIELPENGTLELEGRASSHVGVKSLTLHFRTPLAKIAPRVYRPGASLDADGQYVDSAKASLESDGLYPREIEYMDVVPLQKLKNDRGADILLPAGTVIEYWLEAFDCTESPHPTGLIGKSPVYKITLTQPKPAVQVQSQRQNAIDRHKKFAQGQKNSTTSKSSSPNGGAQNPQQQLDQNKKDNQDAKSKIEKALQDQANQQQHGDTKSGEPQASAAKDGKPDKDAPQSQQKNAEMPPEGAGNQKDQGDGKGSQGQAKEAGDKKSQEGASKGDRKDGPKESPGSAKSDGPMSEPAGGAKSGDAMNQPPQQAKEPGPDDGVPMPTAKGEPQPQGQAKGVEQNGPETRNKDAQAAKGPPPDAVSKGGPMPDAGPGQSKKGPPDQAKQPGEPRGDDAKSKPAEPSLDDLARWLKQLQNPDAKADEAGRAIAAFGQKTDDPKKAELAHEILKKNGRDPKTGKLEKKGPSPVGSGGTSPGLSDDVKLAALNREFAARIGQMQLDDWKKRVNPQVLKKAGLTDADWQRYLKNMQAHDALVRDLNAKLLKDALAKELRGAANPNAGRQTVENTGTTSNLNDGGRGIVPPFLRDTQRLYDELQKKNP